MNLTIEIDCDDAALTDDLTGELSKLFKTIVALLEDHTAPAMFKLFDSNSKKVGTARLTK